jgi:lysyl-tRNA synthetase class 2
MSAASLRDLLRRRAATTDAIRRFFAARAVIEVFTPALSRAATTDPALASLRCELAGPAGRHYLQTSPEHAMKCLLAAGSGDIWQLARVFRDGEVGRWHRPEFLLLEWYRQDFDEFALMDEVHSLLTQLARAAGIELDRLDLAYADAFHSTFGVDPHALNADAAARLQGRLEAAGVTVPAALEGDALLDLALSTVIVPGWPQDTVIFLHDYPASQAALATIKPTRPPVAARFEVFVNGIELGNGFRELTDAAEHRRRFAADLARRRRHGLPVVPIDEQLLAAIEAGLPPCAGVAVGFDRLLAVLARADGLGALPG